jgi:hypothetical protein
MLVEGLRKATKNLIQVNRCPSPDQNPVLTELMSRALPINQATQCNVGCSCGGEVWAQCPRGLDWVCNEVGGGGLHASYLIKRIALVVYFHHVHLCTIGLTSFSEAGTSVRLADLIPCRLFESDSTISDLHAYV